MRYKHLNLDKNRKEEFSRGNDPLRLIFCHDSFDEYFVGEWPCHWHDEFEAGIVLNGEIEYTIYDATGQANSCVLRQGDGIYIQVGRLHEARQTVHGSVVETFCFGTDMFDVKYFSTIYQKFIRPIEKCSVSHIFLKADAERDVSLLAAYQKLMMLSPQDVVYELACTEAICSLWRKLYQYIRPNQSMVLKVPVRENRIHILLDFIYDNYNRNISVDDIARTAGISRTECFRCFKNAMHKTPIQYLLEYRLHEAKCLMLETNRTLTDISLSCGFNSLSYFCKIFKQSCGCTPEEFRRKGESDSNEK